MDFIERWEALKLHSDTSNQLIEDLVYYARHTEAKLRQDNEKLANELNDANLDLDDARRSRRDLQMKLNMANEQLDRSISDHKILQNRNPYVMVLLDGDGTIFKDEFIRSGLDGGKRAANALRTAVLEHYRDLSDDTEIIAKVCANVDGLTKAMKRNGCLDSVEDFRDFTTGFTQGKASFDFIDVGYGKERADSKIKEQSRWHLRNHNCKHILLGVSHDAGYAPFLDEVLRDEALTRKVAIIEGSPIVRELAQTGVRVLSFHDLFRTEKLIDRPPGFPAPLPPPPPSMNLVVEETTKIPFATTTSSVPASWAGMASAPPAAPGPPVMIMPLHTRINGNGSPASVRSKTPWVPGPRGLDEPITIKAAVLSKVRDRPVKFCKNHYLMNYCGNNPCSYEHDYDLSDDELNAVMFLTRLNPCTNGQDCELEYCMYGHHCPTTQSGQCKHKYCRYDKDAHPPGTVIRHPRDA